jgi:tetratricopeptide (TPR) repeat protein
LHHAAAPVERTPKPTTLAIELDAPKPRRRFGTGVALAVVLSAIAAAGFTLYPHRVASVVTFLTTFLPAPTPSPAPTAATAAVEEPAKSAGFAREAPSEAPSAIATALPHESTEIPVSSVTTPNCSQTLGSAFVEKLDPAGAATENQVGQRALVRGDLDAALAAFCKAALWDGGTLERRLNLANLYLIRRDGEHAVEEAARALELDPKNARALEIRADAWARLGKVVDARRAYLAGAQRFESDEAAAKWFVRRDLDAAERSLKARDYARAEKLFLRVVVFEPEHVVATLGVATCLEKLNDHAGAEAWTRRANELANAAVEARGLRSGF